MKKKINFFIVFIIIASVLRIILTSEIPIYIHNSTHDDLLVIQRAMSICDGKWLGDYTNLTLVKGIGFELFLVFFNLLRISYVNAQSIMYILANLYFIYSIRNIIKSKIYLGIIYVLMLFNPISLSYSTFQRVYRYNLIPFQVIFIMSSYYILYENLTKKQGRIWPHVLIATLFLTWFRLTIESYIWIMPFVIVVTILLIINIIKNKRKIISNIIAVIIPLVFMIVIITYIKLINQATYGVFAYNELYDTNFSNALKAIYSVDVHDNIEYVSVSQKKLEKLYEISPSLNSIKENLDDAVDSWMDYDQIKNDEIEDRMVLLAF